MGDQREPLVSERQGAGSADANLAGPTNFRSPSLYFVTRFSGHFVGYRPNIRFEWEKGLFSLLDPHVNPF